MAGAPAIDWVELPSGPFRMGSDPAADCVPDPDEAPRHEVAVGRFRIGRTPVTNGEYGRFVEATGHLPPSHWPEGRVPDGAEGHPVTYVSWDDAGAYCAWAGVRLPSEVEWERAARAGDDRLWPWGDAPPGPAHARFGGAPGPGDVGAHPLGASPFGVLDLAGNVWEWTRSALRRYPYDRHDGRERADAEGARVVRGGSFVHGAREVRCSFRHGFEPGVRDHYVGFRVAAAADGGGDAADWVEIPAGTAVIGAEPRVRTGPAPADEAPQHTVDVAAFELARTPVTNAQYEVFVADTGHLPPCHWRGSEAPAATGEHPVTHVDWHDARAFCAWAGGRLPTEAEWEKAARGTSPRRYPWGSEEPDAGRAHVGAGAKGRTSPVGTRPGGASPYGALDLVGNVWEWVSSAYRPYPYDAADGRERPDLAEPRVLRGGSYASTSDRLVRCASRSRSHPGRRAPHIGFRVAREAAGRGGPAPGPGILDRWIGGR